MNERQREIVDIVYKEKRISVRKLSAILYVSEMTVRRDLAELEKEGFIKRYRGGAVPNESGETMPISQRFFVEDEEKKILAKSAQKHLRDGMRVFIDSSSTCLYLIPAIARFKDITMFTNSVRAVISASKYHIPTVIMGGDYFEHDMCCIGVVTEEDAGRFNYDVAFFSAMGIDRDGMISDNDVAQSSVRRVVMKNSRENVFLFENNKLGERYAFNICHSDEVTEVIFP